VFVSARGEEWRGERRETSSGEERRGNGDGEKRRGGRGLTTISTSSFTSTSSTMEPSAQHVSPSSEKKNQRESGKGKHTIRDTHTVPLDALLARPLAVLLAAAERAVRVLGLR
jgi:hypothetical protein